MRIARAVWRRAWRAGIALMGGAVLVAGLVMLVLPGPGLLTIGAGLALLALEFEAARALRDAFVEWVRARVMREGARGRAR